MAAYLNVDDMTSGEIRAMRLAMIAGLAALDGQRASDETLDAVNALIRESDGAREVALHFARAMALALLSVSPTDEHAAGRLRLLALSLEAAEDVKAEVEFDEALDHSMTHGWKGGAGPDPDCPYCDPEEDA